MLKKVIYLISSVDVIENSTSINLYALIGNIRHVMVNFFNNNYCQLYGIVITTGALNISLPSQDSTCEIQIGKMYMLQSMIIVDTYKMQINSNVLFVTFNAIYLISLAGFLCQSHRSNSKWEVSKVPIVIFLNC